MYPNCNKSDYILIFSKGAIISFCKILNPFQVDSERWKDAMQTLQPTDNLQDAERIQKLPKNL